MSDVIKTVLPERERPVTPRRTEGASNCAAASRAPAHVSAAEFDRRSSNPAPSGDSDEKEACTSSRAGTEPACLRAAPLIPTVENANSTGTERFAFPGRRTARGTQRQARPRYAPQRVFQSSRPTARGLRVRRERPSRRILSAYRGVSKLPERKFHPFCRRNDRISSRRSWLIPAGPRLVNGQNSGYILRALATECVQNTRKTRFGPQKTRFKKSLIISFIAKVNR